MIGLRGKSLLLSLLLLLLELGVVALSLLAQLGGELGLSGLEIGVHLLLQLGRVSRISWVDLRSQQRG